jgi:hypothetical protein
MSTDGPRLSLAPWIAAGDLPDELVTALRRVLPALEDLSIRRWSFRPDGASMRIGAQFDGDDRIGFYPFSAAGPGLSFARSGATVVTKVANDAAEFRIRTDLRVQIPPEFLRSVDDDGAVEAVAEVEAFIAWRTGEDLVVDLSVPAGVDLPLSFIGESGFAVLVEGLFPVLESSALPEDLLVAGFTQEFRGIYLARAEVRLPDWFAVVLPHALVIEHASIDTEGFQGSVLADFSGSTVGGSIFGFGVFLSEIGVNIRANRFAGSSIVGQIRLPFVPADVGFVASLNLSGESLDLSASYDPPLVLNAPGVAVQVSGLRLDGTLGSSGIDLSGEADTVRATFGSLVDIDVADINVRITAGADGRLLEVSVGRANFGPLGFIEDARLSVRESSAGESTGVLAGHLTWGDLASRITIPEFLPLPSPGETVDVSLFWRSDPLAGPSTLSLIISAALVDLDRLFAFLPEPIRPEVESATLQFMLDFASEADFAASGPAADLAGVASVDVRFRLPPVPALFADLITVTTGDASGLIAARLALGTDLAGNARLDLSITNPFAVSFALPGLDQTDPPVSISVTAGEMTLQSTAAAGSAPPQAEGAIRLRGAFAVSPIASPVELPIASHLARLLEPLHMGQLAGDAEFEIRYRDGRVQADLLCVFDDTSIEIAVFEILRDLAQGKATPVGIDEPKSSVDLDLEVGFGLKTLAIQLGSITEPASVAGQGPQASFEVVLDAFVGGATAEGFVRLTDQDLVIGVGEMKIPLRTPRFPLTPADIDNLQEDPIDPASLWTRANIDAALAAYDSRIAELATAHDRDSRIELGELIGKRFLLENLDRIDGTLPADSNRHTFQDAVGLAVDVLWTTTGVFHVESDLNLVIERCAILIPFRDPRGLSIEGGASLRGFSDDDPLQALEGLTMALGISADQIYFSLEGTGQAIPIQEFGRYRKGSVSLGRLTIGYGYTRNSLAVSLAGTLRLPDGLAEDADLSEQIGFGIRLPQDTALAFRLDVVPVPGPIPAVPIFEFSLDLRSPNRPGIAATQTCTPEWDGLQFHVPGVVHTSFKYFAVSPFFSILPIPNLRIDGDIVIGNAENGVTLIVDDALFLAGLSSPPMFLPIPLIADPAYPYFENVCVRVAIAGFGVNFDIQRPFPRFDPLALFDVLALVADPMRPIDQNSALARAIRVAVTDAYISFPPLVRRLFPETEELNRKELNFELNLGIVITLAQSVLKSVGNAASAIAEEGGDLESAVHRLVTHPPEISVSTVLSALPPELRKIRLGGSFAGFDATAVLLLISTTDAQEEMHRRQSSSPRRVQSRHRREPRGLIRGSISSEVHRRRPAPHVLPERSVRQPLPRERVP